MEKGFIITLSGISGAGKSHFIKNILERCDSFEKLKAVTTRKKRKDEKEGIDKFFLKLDDFENKNQNQELCVVNNVFGNMYGYFKEDINKTKSGTNLVTELYYKEVDKFKQEYPNTISVYIVPSDISKTLSELEARNTGYEELNKRVSDIKKELEFFNDSEHQNFDIIIYNNYDLDSIENFIRNVLFKINEKLNNIPQSPYCSIISKTDKKNISIVDNYAKSGISRPVIYTSFDGDDMHYLHDICNYEIDRGNIPLNPETSLGYYVSTVSLGGKKIDVMKDCLTLEMLADKMSVYTKEKRTISEGILAEMLLWNIKKGKGLDIIEGITHLSEGEILQNLSEKELENRLLKIDPILKYELFNNLLNTYSKENHQSAYIIANMENFKHIDWARSYCYKHGICPVSPQNILPLYLFKGNDKLYLESRLELLKRTDKVLLFIDRNNSNEDIKRLDQYSLSEIYYLNKYLQNKQIELIGWDEALVPKYNQTNKWSLTTKEDIQVRKMLK